MPTGILKSPPNSALNAIFVAPSVQRTPFRVIDAQLIFKQVRGDDPRIGLDTMFEPPEVKEYLHDPVGHRHPLEHGIDRGRAVNRFHLMKRVVNVVDSMRVEDFQLPLPAVVDCELDGVGLQCSAAPHVNAVLRQNASGTRGGYVFVDDASSDLR